MGIPDAESVPNMSDLPNSLGLELDDLLFDLSAVTPAPQNTPKSEDIPSVMGVHESDEMVLARVIPEPSADPEA